MTVFCCWEFGGEKFMMTDCHVVHAEKKHEIKDKIDYFGVLSVGVTAVGAEEGMLAAQILLEFAEKNSKPVDITSINFANAVCLCMNEIRSACVLKNSDLLDLDSSTLYLIQGGSFGFLEFSPNNGIFVLKEEFHPLPPSHQLMNIGGRVFKKTIEARPDQSSLWQVMIQKWSLLGAPYHLDIESPKCTLTVAPQNLLRRSSCSQNISDFVASYFLGKDDANYERVKQKAWIADLT